MAGLVWRQDRLGGLDLLDSRGWYTPGEAAALFDDLDRLDANARFVYAATGLTVDMAVPVAYGLLLAILLFRLWRGGVQLYLLPLAMAAADVLENATIAALALGSPAAVKRRRERGDADPTHCHSGFADPHTGPTGPCRRWPPRARWTGTTPCSAA